MRAILLICLFAATAAAQTMPKIEPGVSHELAKWRASQYSNISYKLDLTLEKMSPVLKGSIEIRVTQAAYACSEPNCPYVSIVLDWRTIPGHEKKSTLSKVEINGKSVEEIDENSQYYGTDPVYRVGSDHIFFHDGVRMGENVIKLDFTSPILTSGSAVTRYIDKEDGSEYIYSLFVPSDASTAFPCFDQPDLKAKFKLRIDFPWDWTAVVANTHAESFTFAPYAPDKDSLKFTEFAETKPISTYVFAFAAGPFQAFSNKQGVILEPGFVDPRISNGPVADVMKVYVRKSQAAKFKPHAAEVFRLTREGIKYLEQYFDHKFPFPKLDLVLIPEFPFGGMEHAGAVFLREDRVIFPAEPTKGDHITRANLIFHETAHQWFGDTVTMRWFDDLWLKEGFAEFMAYKTLEKVMPDANAWKVFYERNKQAAYATDSTRGTTPIYQPIANLSAAKSAYGNIVYRKAPSFLRQAEFYLGEDKFQTAVRAFLKKHEFGNAGWEDLVKEFETAGNPELQDWAARWVMTSGAPIIRATGMRGGIGCFGYDFTQSATAGANGTWQMRMKTLVRFAGEKSWSGDFVLQAAVTGHSVCDAISNPDPKVVLLNYQDYGYGIFLLDDKSRDHVLKNIQNEKDPFLRSMMWGALWDSVREAELDPKDYVELAIKALSPGFSRPSGKTPPEGGTQNASENDETTVQAILGRVNTAMNYYVSDAQRAAIAPRLEAMLLDRLQHAPTPGLRVTFYRAFVGNATTAKGREVLKQMLGQGGNPTRAPLRAKDRFDIVTRLAILGDAEAPKLLAELERTETSDDAKRYAYAARAAFGTAENKAKFFNDFVTDKALSESWVESAIVPFNSMRHAALTQQYLERSLRELSNLKRTRKIFFINNWLAAFIGGQRDEKALAIVNKFLADNPNLDNDLRLKVLENVDLIERAVKIRAKYAK